MSNSKPIPATVAEIKEAIPDAGSDFILDQIAANATLEDARQAYLAERSRQLEAEVLNCRSSIEAIKEEHASELAEKDAEIALQAERIEALEAGDAAKQAKIEELEKQIALRADGVDGVDSGSQADENGSKADGTYQEQWQSLIAKYKAEGLDNVAAGTKARKEHMDVYKGWLAEVNARNNRPVNLEGVD